MVFAMDSKEIDERIKAEAIRQHTVSVDPNAPKAGAPTINMTDGVLIPKKGSKHVLTSWRLTFFGALVLSAVLIIFFPDPYRTIFITCLRGAPVTFEVTVFSIIGAVIKIVRAGIQAIPKGQMEAAIALGMTRSQAFRYIILPQTVKVILPAIGNEFISMLKDSSLVSVLSLEDILRCGRMYISRTFLSLETMLVVALIYLIITLVLSRIVGLLEERLHKNG